jgi:predicted DNA-binding transcriptional regulator AlpA
MEILTKAETIAAINAAVAPLIRQLEIANRVLAKIPLEVSTKEAMAMTGIKSRHTLDKHFTAMQDGERGRVTYSRIEIETWIEERKLIAA